jgi:FAD synthetase
MVRVMATGVFDLLHPGHVHYLDEARKLGDELLVVVARDSTARRLKHEPIIREEDRLRMVSALKPVDKAILGNEGNIFDILTAVRPDIIALGYDQAQDEARLLAECRARGLTGTRVVRCPKYEGDLDGTRRIIGRVGEYLAMAGRLREVEGSKGAGK